MSEVEVYEAPGDSASVSEMSEMSESSALSDSPNSSLSDWELVDVVQVVEFQDPEIPDLVVPVPVPVEVEVEVVLSDSDAGLPIAQVINELNNLSVSGTKSEIKSDEAYDGGPRPSTSTSNNSDDIPELEDNDLSAQSYYFKLFDLDPHLLRTGQGYVPKEIAQIAAEIARSILDQIAAEKVNKKCESLTALEIIEQNLRGQEATLGKTNKLQRDFLHNFNDDAPALNEDVRAEWETQAQLESDVKISYEKNENLRKEIRHLQTELARLTAENYSRGTTNI